MADVPELTLEDLISIQPGLARLMPEIGERMWKCYYAAKAQSWENAAWQLRETRKLFALCMTTRPKYADDLNQFIEEQLQPLADAVQSNDWGAFESSFKTAAEAGNDFHGKYKKPWIVWKLPDSPPPDLDFSQPKASE